MDEILSRCFDVWKKNWKYELNEPRNWESSIYHEYIPFGEIVNDKPHGTWWILRTNEFNEKVIDTIQNYNNGLLDGDFFGYSHTQSICIYKKYIRGQFIKRINYEPTMYIGRRGIKTAVLSTGYEFYTKKYKKYYPIPDIFKDIIPKSFQNSDICEDKYF